MARLLANRFDVHAGSTAIGTFGIFVRATVSSARCTVPSPPQSISKSGPVARAARTASGTFLLFVTSCHATSIWPRRRNSVRSSGRPPRDSSSREPPPGSSQDHECPHRKIATRQFSYRCLPAPSTPPTRWAVVDALRARPVLRWPDADHDLRCDKAFSASERPRHAQRSGGTTSNVSSSKPQLLNASPRQGFRRDVVVEQEQRPSASRLTLLGRSRGGRSSLGRARHVAGMYGGGGRSRHRLAGGQRTTVNGSERTRPHAARATVESDTSGEGGSAKVRSLHPVRRSGGDGEFRAAPAVTAVVVWWTILTVTIARRLSGRYRGLVPHHSATG